MRNIREFRLIDAESVVMALAMLDYEILDRSADRNIRTKRNDRKELDSAHKVNPMTIGRLIFVKENSKLGFCLSGITPNADDGGKFLLSIGPVMPISRFEKDEHGKTQVIDSVEVFPVWEVYSERHQGNCPKRPDFLALATEKLSEVEQLTAKMAKVGVNPQFVSKFYATINQQRLETDRAKTDINPRNPSRNKLELLLNGLSDFIGNAGRSGTCLTKWRKIERIPRWMMDILDPK